MSVAAEYLTGRGFAPEMIERVGWRVAPLGRRARRYGLPADAADVLAWSIPYPARDDRSAFERVRLIEPADLDRFGGGKYRQPAGVGLDLYDPFGWLGREPYDALLLIEGEANAVAVAEMAPELPVVGLPGRGALSTALAERIGPLPLVYVWIDPDEAHYEEQLSQIAERLTAVGVDEVRKLPPMPQDPDSRQVMDAADVLRIAGPEEGGGWLTDALDAAAPVPVESRAPVAGDAASRDCFPLLSAAELLTLPPPEWLIDGLVPAVGLSVIYGRSGAGKSFLAIDWALCVASGVPWLGHEVKQRPVVYIAAEGRGGLGVRYRAWTTARGAPDTTAIQFLPEAVRLLEDGAVERLRRTLSTLPERPGLVVIDTMARSLVGGDENSAKDVGAFVAAIDGLADAVLVVHHTGKTGNAERGSSALRAAADLMAKVDRAGRTPRLTLSCDKLKEAEEWAPLALSMKPICGSLVIARREDDGEAEEDGDVETLVLSWVRDHGPASGTRVADGVRKRKRDVLAAIRALEEAGKVERTSGRLVAVPKNREPARNRDRADPGGGSQGDDPVGVPGEPSGRETTPPTGLTAVAGR